MAPPLIVASNCKKTESSYMWTHLNPQMGIHDVKCVFYVSA